MKKVIVILVLVGLGVFGWWAISPLFIDKAVDEEMPEITDADVVRSADKPMLMKTYPIEGTSLHPAHGSVRLLESDGDTIVRYEDYSGTNGPDLYVYLAKDLNAKDFVSLGQAKGNMGNINYTVPDDVDIRDYQYVLTWCKAFGVLFDYAEIQ